MDPPIRQDLATRLTRWDTFQRRLGNAGIAAAVSIACGIATWKFEPLSDPVDVVGIPLLTGYSERSEFLGLAAAVTAAATAAYFISSFRSGSLRWNFGNGLVATLAVLWLTACGAWWRDGDAAVTASMVGIFGYGAGGCLASQPVQASRWLSAFLLLVIGFAFPESIQLISTPSFALPVILSGTLVVFAMARLFGLSIDQAFAKLAIAYGIGSVLIGGPVRLIQSLTAVAAVGCGVFAAQQLHPISAGGRGRTFASPLALLTAIIIGGSAYCNARWATADRWESARNFAGGTATGLLIASAFPIPLVAYGQRLLALVGNTIFRRVVLATAVAALCWKKPYLGFSTGTLVFGCELQEKTRRAWTLTVGLACAVMFLPSMGVRGFDAFHDGQILSAVWEVQSGRSLYDQVFPLRSFEFFTTWLGFACFGSTPATYFLTESIPAMLAAPGMFAVVYVWTRRIPYSLAAALAVALLPALDARMAMHYWLAFVALIALRSKRPPAWFALAGCAAGFCGFDTFVPFIAAAMASWLLAAMPLTTCARALANSALAFSGTAGAFTCLVLLWQGPESALWHWRLLIDYSKNYGAFFGLPMPWDNRESALGIAVPIGTLVGWWAIGGAGISRMTPSKRGSWAFLAVQSLLIFQRGFGRSDIPHLKALQYPTLLLATLGVFELLRVLRAEWRVSIARGQCRGFRLGETLALAAIAIGIVMSANREKQSPRRFVRQFERIVAKAGAWPSEDEDLQRRIPNDGWLWEMENGMLNFTQQRHNPTRHALGYCIGTPAEQLAAADAIAERRPTIVWSFESGTDNVPNPLRFLLMMPTIYREFRPLPGTRLLVPKSEADAISQPLDNAFVGRIDFGRLPMSWGDRIEPARFHPIREIGLNKTSVLHSDSDRGPAFDFAAAFNTRPEDFLLINAVLTPAPNSDDPDAKYNVEQIKFRRSVLVEMGVGTEIDDRATLRFAATADARSQRYIVPVGCSPSWSWSRRLETVRIWPPAGRKFTQIQCAATSSPWSSGQGK